MAAVCARRLLFTNTRSLPLVYRRFSNIEKESPQTTVKFVTDNDEGGKEIPPYVTKYSTQGFRVKNVKVFGSVAIIPDNFFHWKVQRPEEISPESLSLFTLTDPPTEIVVVGTGEKIVRLSPKVYKYMKENRILLEVQDTKNAAATFNFMLEEGRLVGAALIPPLTIKD
ncbi:predicted protein [Nematostella vectensis]|uniref:NADH dehydrogenase [ubiquinone] 1 alpha subcomplex assembly factor 3 n=1 Tax=Nematostella vectensis TaxID=45351 RepID=A7SIF4_NEMVE|nr:NADH dehydrogenase [ubiquinone] 1 alpha subcomplex assembly factor 3 [Nematostella vectensis]EDO36524.1 predicted protein [Nematostella vectensis]|eukprot:XP_001628587.1 predicted protein [Nematostella vectensis]